jgi:hypothetical protein
MPLPTGSAAAAGGQQPEPPAVEVSLSDDGSLAVASCPQLQHPLTGEPVRLALPLDAAAGLGADRLLLQAAAGSAALQLAAVQAVLQRGGRLAPAGVHSQLVLPPVAPTGAPPASPLLQLWLGGALQLSLSLQLRSGRLLLAAREGGEGGAAAAAVQAAQQQLDSAQREALTQPIPAGTSRGMQAARLAAAVLARLSLQLAMRARIEAAAAAAAAAGLQRTTLPPRLLHQHLDQVALLLAPPSPHTLTLALPAFPPPRDMPRWARQQQQRGGAAAGGAAPLDTGATRCCLLVDFGAAAAEQQPAGGNSGGERLGASPRLLFAVCSCTGRGTVTRIRQLAELPPTLLAEARAAAAPTGGPPAASRKRRAEEEEAAGAPCAPAAAESGGLGLDLAALLPWCRRHASWAALRAQMQLLPVQYAEELPLPSAQRAQQRQHHIMRLPKAPALDELERWAAARLAATGGGGAAAAAPPPRKPVAAMRLAADDAAAAAGAWQVDVASTYFGGLQGLLEGQGVALAAPAPDAAHIHAHGGGLTLRYSLQQGERR